VLQCFAFEVLLLRGADESKAVRYINPLICCSVLAVCCNIEIHESLDLLQCVLQCVAVCCRVLYVVAECCSVMQCVAVRCSVLLLRCYSYGVPTIPTLCDT